MAGPNDRLINQNAGAIANRFLKQAQAEMDAVWADANAKYQAIAARQTQALRDALTVSGFDHGGVKITPYEVTTAVRRGGGLVGALGIRPKK